MKISRTFTLGLLCLSILGGSPLGPQFSTIFAQGTAFTYQGRLTDGGSAANGRYDLTFSLFDASSGGTAVAGPITSSAVAVTNGLFAVHVDFGGGVFTGAARWLQVGVRTNGSVGPFTALTPRQAITAAPYATTALNVTGPIHGNSIVDGTITGAQLANGAVTAANIAGNSITAGQLAPGAAAVNLQAGGQSAVPGGGMILSSNANDAALMAAGYFKLGKVDLGDAWEQRASAGAPSPRSSHTAIWTGSEMIVWGGFNGSNALNTGGRYHPTSNTWTALAADGAPAVRYVHTAVWTGTEMIIWGGFDGSSSLNKGARYDPARDKWTSVTTSGAPSARHNHTAVWTGSEMIVWGGFNGTSVLNGGGRYDPVANSWTALTTNGAPAGRQLHTALWTGSQMIVWGGRAFGNIWNDGWIFDGGWLPVTAQGAPAARYGHAAVWTGSEVIVWGGSGSSGPFNDGGRYHLASKQWTNALPTSASPAPRFNHTVVWTGNEMIIWGGSTVAGDTTNDFSDGGRFSPAGQGWSAVSANSALGPRGDHTAVWTGSEMIVCGGANGSASFNDTFSYTPSRALYLYQRP